MLRPAPVEAVGRSVCGPSTLRPYIAGGQERFRESGEWLIKGLAAFRRANDPHQAQTVASNFLVFYGRASNDDKAALLTMWEQAGLGPFPEQARKAGN